MFRPQRYMVMAGLLVIAVQASAQGQFTVTTPNDCLNLRSAGSRKSDVQTCLKDGSRLEVLGAANAGGFVKVRTASGQLGYVHSRQISPAASVAQTQPRTPTKLAQSEFLTVDEPAAQAPPAIRQPTNPPSSLTSAAQTIAVPPAAPAKVQPAIDSGECQTLQLVYSSEDVPGTRYNRPVLWGGNAVDADDRHLMSTEFINAAKTAKAAGHATMVYLGGPCGKTNGSDPMHEEANCAAKFQAYNRAHRNETLNIPGMPSPLPDKKEYRWLPYTLAQLKMSKALKLDYCEIDNLDNSMGWQPFYKLYKSMFDRGQIHCQIAPKNPREGHQFAEIPKLFGKNPAFIGNLAIQEGDEENGPVEDDQVQAIKSSLEPAFQRIKGPGAVVFVSKRSGQYRSKNFTQDSVRHCDRPDVQTASNDGQPAAAPDQTEAAK